MIDFQKYNVEFDESYDNGEFLTTTFYFTASKDILALFMPPEDYAEAVLAEISVEMSNQFPEPAFCACSISPTREFDGGLEDYDWRNIALTDEEINNLLKLAGGSNE